MIARQNSYYLIATVSRCNLRALCMLHLAKGGPIPALYSFFPGLFSFRVSSVMFADFTTSQSAVWNWEDNQHSGSQGILAGSPGDTAAVLYVLVFLVPFPFSYRIFLLPIFAWCQYYFCESTFGNFFSETDLRVLPAPAFSYPTAEFSRLKVSVFAPLFRLASILRGPAAGRYWSSSKW